MPLLSLKVPVFRGASAGPCVLHSLVHGRMSSLEAGAGHTACASHSRPGRRSCGQQRWPGPGALRGSQVWVGVPHVKGAGLQEPEDS